MPRGKAIFRKSDVERAIRAAIAGGIVVSRIEIEPDGKIIVAGVNDNVPDPIKGGQNEWDDAA